jgi:CelD/BcsL family acetyltransferase involved in cellulose biosynthesis
MMPVWHYIRIASGRVSVESAELQLMRESHQVVFCREALPSLPVLEREWRILESVASPSFFTSWQWIGTLVSAIPPANRPKLLRGRMNGETIALALLGANQRRRRRGLIRSRTLYLNETGDARFDSLTIEHNGILMATGWEKAIWDGVVNWFAGICKEADELHLSGSVSRFPEDSLEAYGLARSETVLPSYSVDLYRLAASDGELYPVLSANARQQLRRAVRYFERYGPVHLSEAENVAEALRFFASLKALHCASWERRGKPHSFTGEFFEPFHRLLIERSFAKGGTRLLRASAGNRVIGYLYNFQSGNRIYTYQSGFDDANRRERPGIVTHALAIRHAFRSGAAVYDFMAGHNRLKESFATCCEPMVWQVIQQNRLAFRLEDLARRLKQALSSAGPRAERLSGEKELADGTARRYGSAAHSRISRR